MEAEILFPEILSFGSVNERKAKISRSKRRRLKKKAKWKMSIREDDGAVRFPAIQSTDGLSQHIGGSSPAIGQDEAVKKKPEQLSDVPPVKEDDDKRKSASLQLSSLIAKSTTNVVGSSVMPFNMENSVLKCFQNSTDPPVSELVDDEGSLITDVHCTIRTRLGVRTLKQKEQCIALTYRGKLPSNILLEIREVANF